MATIQENLQIIANSTASIKQAIIDKGGTISGDITTWADAIRNISTSPVVKTISFTLNNSQYNAEESMTWRQWLSSSYCPVSNMYVINSNYIDHMSGRYSIGYITGAYVLADDIIEDGISSSNKNLSTTFIVKSYLISAIVPSNSLS